MNPALPPRMADQPETPQPLTLKRWSQRKLDAARKAAAPEAASSAAPVPAAGAPESTLVATPEAVPLPPVESLDFESDYAAFMQPKVSEETKRAALKKLFSDPSFNVMDGLDIYVGDYTQPDPMPAGMLDKLSAVYAMLDPVAPPPDAPAPAGTPPAVIGAAPLPKPQESLPPQSPPAREAAPDIAAESPPTPAAATDSPKKPA